MRLATDWKQPFDNPLPLPRGRKLVTLKDAANYIQKLPKAVAGAAKCDRANMTFLFGKSALRRITTATPSSVAMNGSATK